eukprot:PhF_6_TR38615/c0_g1_i1/m.57527
MDARQIPTASSVKMLEPAKKAANRLSLKAVVTMDARGILSRTRVNPPAQIVTSPQQLARRTPRVSGIPSVGSAGPNVTHCSATAPVLLTRYVKSMPTLERARLNVSTSSHLLSVIQWPAPSVVGHLVDAHCSAVKLQTRPSAPSSLLVTWIPLVSHA